MKVTFITLTNSGYLPYTLNCLKSLREIGVDELKCYAIGNKAYRRISRVNATAECIRDEANTDFQVFRRGDWAQVTFYKFEIIHANLRTSDFVCFTDGDIVFKDARVLDYCRENIGGHDLLIQNDSMDDASGENLCSGFMFIRSNPATLRYFDPEYVKANSKITEGWDDQVYVNQIKDRLRFGLLPLALFPNGKYFTTNHRALTPY
ncbi:MAG: putative nucleotide-diphospho-sugar transferase, partial [Bacteroidota bacterium]